MQTVLRFYAKRMAREGLTKGRSGAIAVVQRASSDLKLTPSGVTKRVNPHLHALYVDGVYEERGDHVLLHAPPHLSTREVGEVLQEAVKRIVRYVRRSSSMCSGRRSRRSA